VHPCVCVTALCGISIAAHLGNNLIVYQLSPVTLQIIVNSCYVALTQTSLIASVSEHLSMR